jgi:hypothetical protein
MFPQTKKLLRLWWDNKYNFKTRASTISLPLSFIFNHSLHAGIFPDHLKIVVVKPLHKKADKYNMTNHRPVSLLPIFPKVFESYAE